MPVDLPKSRIRPKTARFRREARALGNRVRALREAQGWTLERAAEKMDVDWKHLQKLEAGAINVTLATLVRVAAGLRCPISTLFSEAEQPVANRHSAGF